MKTQISVNEFDERLKKIEEKAAKLGVIGIDNYNISNNPDKELSEIEYCLNDIEKMEL